jgi:hypothetical protein
MHGARSQKKFLKITSNSRIDRQPLRPIDFLAADKLLWPALYSSYQPAGKVGAAGLVGGSLGVCATHLHVAAARNACRHRSVWNSSLAMKCLGQRRISAFKSPSPVRRAEQQWSLLLPAETHHSTPMQCRIGLAVAAAIQTVAVGLAGAGR